MEVEASLACERANTRGTWQKDFTPNLQLLTPTYWVCQIYQSKTTLMMLVVWILHLLGFVSIVAAIESDTQVRPVSRTPSAYHFFSFKSQNGIV